MEVPEEQPTFGFLSARGRVWTEVAATEVASREHLVKLVARQL